MEYNINLSNKKKLVFIVLVSLSIFLSSCQDISPSPPQDVIKSTGYNCKDYSSEVLFKYEGGNEECISLPEIQRSERLSNDFVDPSVTKILPSWNMDTHNPNFKRVLVFYDRLDELFNLNFLLYTDGYSKLLLPGQRALTLTKYKFEGSSVIGKNSNNLQECYSGSYLRIEDKTSEKVTCLGEKSVKIGTVKASPRNMELKNILLDKNYEKDIGYATGIDMGVDELRGAGANGDNALKRGYILRDIMLEEYNILFLNEWIDVAVHRPDPGQDRDFVCDPLLDAGMETGNANNDDDSEGNALINILDVVAIVQCVLNGYCWPPGVDEEDIIDTDDCSCGFNANGDFEIDILDIVAVVQGILNSEWGNMGTSCGYCSALSNTPNPDYCENADDPCCGPDHCLNAAETYCGAVDGSAVTCAGEGICSGNVMVSGAVYTCDGYNPGCGGTFEEVNDVMYNCGANEQCFHPSESNVQAFCGGKTTDCSASFSGGGTVMRESGTALPAEVRFHNGFLSTVVKDKYNDKQRTDLKSYSSAVEKHDKLTGEIIEVVMGGGVYDVLGDGTLDYRSNTCEDIEYWGFQNPSEACIGSWDPAGACLGTQIATVRFGTCTCSSDRKEGDIPMHGWWINEEGGDAFVSNTMGCENDLNCDSGDSLECLMKPFKRSGEGGQQEYNTGWNWEYPVVFKEENGEMFKISNFPDPGTWDDSVCGTAPSCTKQFITYKNHNSEEYDWTIDWSGYPNYEWFVGPCGDGFGIFCEGDGICESEGSQDSGNANFNYNEGNWAWQYERYSNSPSDCDMTYILNLMVGGLASPYGETARDKCDSANLYGWEHPDDGYWGGSNADPIYDATECPSGFQKIYFSDYIGNTYLYGEVLVDDAGDVDVVTGEQMKILTLPQIENAYEHLDGHCYAGADDGEICYQTWDYFDGILDYNAWASVNSGAGTIGNLYGFSTWVNQDAHMLGEDNLHCGSDWGNDEQDELIANNWKRLGLNLFDHDDSTLNQVCGVRDPQTGQIVPGGCNYRVVGINMNDVWNEENAYFTIGTSPTDTWVGVPPIFKHWEIDGIPDTTVDYVLDTDFCRAMCEWAAQEGGESGDCGQCTDYHLWDLWDWWDSDDPGDPDPAQLKGEYIFGSGREDVGAVFSGSDGWGSDNDVDTGEWGRWHCCMDNADRKKIYSVIGCVAPLVQE